MKRLCVALLLFFAAGPVRPDPLADSRGRLEEIQKRHEAELTAARERQFQQQQQLKQAQIDRDKALAAQRKQQLKLLDPSDPLGLKARAQLEEKNRKAEEEAARQQVMHKGVEYALASQTRWTLTEVDSPMTEHKLLSVVSEQRNDRGLVAFLQVKCEPTNFLPRVDFIATILDEQGEGVDISSSGKMIMGSSVYLVTRRYNDRDPEQAVVRFGEYDNQLILMSYGLFAHQKSEPIWTLLGDPHLEDLWRVMYEVTIPRERKIVIQLPIWNESVHQVVNYCQSLAMP